MTVGYSTAVRNARLDAITTALGSGGKVRIYNGTRPATGGTVTTLLAELTCSNPAAPGASSGLLTMSAITADSTADNTGTATWFRLVDASNVFVMDGDAGTSGTELVLTTAAFVAGARIEITSFTITAGNA
jgi:hypothetical protein